MTLIRSLRPAVILFAGSVLLLGLVYPLVLTLIAGAAFPIQAHGSLTMDADGSVDGSLLIARDVTDPRYFHFRPSAVDWNGAGSGGSNLGPTNPAFLDRVNRSIAELRAAGVTGLIPGDLVTTSGSGLDPHLSVEAALLQAPAVTAARNRSIDEVRALVVANRVVDPMPFHPEYVNVNTLNQALDGR